MKILNTTTGKIEELTYSPTGCDCLSDLTAADTSITYNRETETHEAEGDAIGWWKTWIAEQEELDTLWASVKKDFDDESKEEIRKDMECAQDCDMEDQPRAGKAAIMAWMEENGYVMKTYDDGSIEFVAHAALEYEDAKDFGSPHPTLAALESDPDVKDASWIDKA
jgi:hypothetical protein